MSNTEPWPFRSAPWPDSPWVMSGNVATAWFRADPAQLRLLAADDFEPVDSERNARLRFYDIEATGGGVTIPFREAVLAYKTTYRGVEGELSAVMKSDSHTYLSWGREVFGWPIEPGEIHLNGGIWDQSPGDAVCIAGASRLTFSRGASKSPASTAQSVWITPRRVASPIGPDIRVVYAVRPEVVEAGNTYACTGDLEIGDLLTSASNVEIECTVGATIRVGSDVSVLE